MSQTDEVLSPKDIIKQKILAEMLSGVKTKAEIAKKVGVSRPTLNKYLKDMNRNEILSAELEAVKDEILPMIIEMAKNPDNPLQKAAIDNSMKYILKLIDKFSPNLNQNINMNINMDEYTETQKTNRLYKTAISRLPPTMRDAFFKHVEQLKQEWGWETNLT